MNTSSPKDISKQWVRHLRESTRATEIFVCPWCAEHPVFANEAKLLEHCRSIHDEQVDREADESLQSFRQRIRQAMAQQFTDPSMRIGKPQADQIFDDEFSRISEAVHNIHDIQKLSLTKSRDSAMRDAPIQASSTSPPLSPLSSRKRAAGTDLAPTDLSYKIRTPGSESPTHPRRAKARSGEGQYGNTLPRKRLDPDFQRTLPGVEGAEIARQATGPKRLYNPTTDKPLFRSEMVGVVDSSNLSPVSGLSRVFEKHSWPRKEAPRKKDGRIPPKEVRPGSPKATMRQAQPHHILQPQSVEPHNSDPTRLKQDNIGLVLQPETRPISQDQLVAEVKGIYAGLVMIEAKCVDVDNKQALAAQEAEPGRQPKLNNEQWQALIAMHRTLLHEHHDFFLASQHPSASSSLRRLASKYAMPARMWRYGIHSFLELLRHRLPDSLEHMLAFIYIAYSMMALLYETVPTFENTWVECLGDLRRYRIAIEDDDIRDREIWTGVARFWYSKAADKSPTVGRLYHHLAILARPNALQQLYYYTRSLTCVEPFLSARESILTLFDPILGGYEPSYRRSLPVDTAFIKAHGLLFPGVGMDSFNDVVEELLGLLDNHISRVTSAWKEQGVYIAVANVASLFNYGAKDAFFKIAFVEAMRARLNQAVDTDHSVQGSEAMPPVPSDKLSENVSSPAKGSLERPEQSADLSSQPLEVSELDLSSGIALSYASHITFSTFGLALQRVGDTNVLLHVHVTLVFLSNLAYVERAMRCVEKDAPWEDLATFLNTLMDSYDVDPRLEKDAFPQPEIGFGRPLPEDFNIRGLEWAQLYFPPGWIENAMVDDEERSLELPSMNADRVERVLWLGVRIAKHGYWLQYDPSTREFSVARHITDIIVASQQQERLYSGRQSSSVQDDADTPMSGTIETENEEQDLEDALPEVRKLRLEHQQLEAELHSGAPQPRGPSEVGHQKNIDTLLKQFGTVMVVDTNLFLRALDAFSSMVNRDGWSVVIPNSVITELTRIAKKAPTAKTWKVAKLFHSLPPWITAASLLLCLVTGVNGWPPDTALTASRNRDSHHSASMLFIFTLWLMITGAIYSVFDSMFKAPVTETVSGVLMGSLATVWGPVKSDDRTTPSLQLRGVGSLFLLWVSTTWIYVGTLFHREKIDRLHLLGAVTFPVILLGFITQLRQTDPEEAILYFPLLASVSIFAVSNSKEITRVAADCISGARALVLESVSHAATFIASSTATTRVEASDTDIERASDLRMPNAEA